MKSLWKLFQIQFYSGNENKYRIFCSESKMNHFAFQKQIISYKNYQKADGKEAAFSPQGTSWFWKATSIISSYAWSATLIPLKALELRQLTREK